MALVENPKAMADGSTVVKDREAVKVISLPEEVAVEELAGEPKPVPNVNPVKIEGYEPNKIISANYVLNPADEARIVEIYRQPDFEQTLLIRDREKALEELRNANEKLLKSGQNKSSLPPGYQPKGR